jgi:hypothetical protein
MLLVFDELACDITGEEQDPANFLMVETSFPVC